MALTKITGTVSNFREETEVTSTQTYKSGYSKVNTQKIINFRVDNRPVSMKMPKSLELTDGDEATVVGTQSGGGLKAILISNDTTGIVYGYGTIYMLAWAVILMLIGLATMSVFIGFIIFPLGLYLLYKGLQLKKAHALIAT